MNEGKMNNLPGEVRRPSSEPGMDRKTGKGWDDIDKSGRDCQ
jgi:hypothetical protein